jgi:phosphohistidine phosphatase
VRLYFLRHADADVPAKDDDLRPLSQKGIVQAGRVGRFCKVRQIRPDLVLTSPLMRARETAGHFLSEFEKPPPLEIAPFLKGGIKPVMLLIRLKAFEKHSRLMIIGHEPSFSELMATLLGLPNAGALHIRKASLTLIDVEKWRAGGGRLKFSIPCKLM